MTALGCHDQDDRRFQSRYPSLSLVLGTNCDPETLDHARSSWRIVRWWEPRLCATDYGVDLT